MRVRMLGVTLALSLMCLATVRPAYGAAILFEAADLADSTPGEDLWRYSYRVIDFVFGQNMAFEVLFDPLLFALLEDPPPPVNPDWDVVTFPTQPVVPEPGRYSALALVDGASLGDLFTVSFVWLGGPQEAPGAQAFEIVQFDEFSNFVGTLETGQTSAASVPEPATLVLLAIALPGLAAARKRSRRR